MRCYGMQSRGPSGARSMPNWAGKSSNNELRDQGRKIEGLSRHYLFRRSDKVFFMYGFSKSQRANVNNQEEQQFKEAAKTVLALTETQLAVRFKRGDLVEARNE